MTLPTVLPLCRETLRLLLRAPSGVCGTMVVPTPGVTAGGRAPTSFRRLLDDLHLTLATTRSREQVDRVLYPWRSLEGHPLLWDLGGDGFAGFATDGGAWIVPLGGRILPGVTVGKRFRTWPLVQRIASLECCRVVMVAGRSVRVVDAADDAEGGTRLSPVPLRGAGGWSFRDGRVSRDVTEGLVCGRGDGAVHAARPLSRTTVGGCGLPDEAVDEGTRRFLELVAGMVAAAPWPPSATLLVIGLPGDTAAFLEGMPLHRRPCVRKSLPSQLVGDAELAHLVEDVLGMIRRRRWIARVAAFREARSQGRGAGDFSDIARAAAAGQVETLLLEEGRHEEGCIDPRTGAIEFPLESDGAGDRLPGVCDDLYGALAELVHGHSGDVVSVPPAMMPTRSGVAAIYRCGDAGGTHHWAGWCTATTVDRR